MSFKTEKMCKELVLARSRPSTIIDLSKWNSRGWTNQERPFSHRMLIFTDEQLLYWCRRTSWCEDTVLETDNEHVHYEDTPLYRFSVRNDPSVAFMKQLEESPAISMFEEYSKIVSEFCRRDLFFEGDILDAFAGLLRSFKASYKPSPHLLTYYFDLPSIWFDHSLLWTPLPNSVGIRRRNALFRNLSGDVIPFPSWSWTGWVGQTYYQYPSNIEARTRSEIKWFSFGDSGSVSLLTSGQDLAYPLPEWFQSSSGPRPLRGKWKPLDAPVDVQQTGVLDQGHYSRSGTHLLMFYTSSGYLPIIERHDGLEARRSESSIIREYFIAGEGKGLIGLDAEWVASHHSPLYEFVVISRSMENDWDNPGMCDSLNVMLIERCGDATYRVGVGTVSELTWVLAEPEWKFIQLG